MAIPARAKSDIKQEICRRIAAGESVAGIFSSRDVGIGEATFWRWLVADKDFLLAYEKATQLRAEKYGDEAIAISKERPPLVSTGFGDPKVDTGYVQWQKLRIDTLQWNAARMLPRRFGDRTVIAGDAENPLRVEHADAVEALLARPAIAVGLDGTTGPDGETIQ